MKSRSHRLPMTEPRHDDWVDGSWTVDCICGVTDDDGEEMVDCDECGVWVHTRCSRYVKSEKSFACDKCKSKNSGGGAAAAGGGGCRNDSEETEVAEFLLELPTKTLRMENTNPVTVSSHRPFRLWTNIPMEERVHVQGVPGGEPALFSGIGMSSIFGPQLWKCSGYVPKKFNFRHTEFPFLGNGEVEEKEDKTIGEENSTRADNDAGVLITLLKKNSNPLPTPEVDSVGVKRPVEGGTSCEVVTPREKKKADVEIPNYKTPEEGKKKESSSVPVLLHPGKRRKEGNGMKDQPMKKKVRTIEKEGDVRKRALHSSKAVASTFSSDGKHVEFSQDRGSKAANNGIGNRLLDGLGECATNLASNEHATLRNDVSSDEISRGGNIGDKVLVGSDNVSKTSNNLEALAEVSGSKSTPINEEAAKDGLHRCSGEAGTAEIGVRERKPVAVDVRIAGEDAKQSEHRQDSDIDEANSRPNKKLKGELKADHCVESSNLIDVKLDSNKTTSQHPESTVDVDFEESKVVEKSPISSEASEPKELKHSSEGSLGPRKQSSGLKHTSEVADELLKSNNTARSNSTASYQRKSAVSGLKSSSSSGCIASKSPETVITATVQSPPTCRLKESSEGSSLVVKDNTSTHKVEPDDKCGRLKKLVKEPSRSKSLPKTSESNRLSNTSDSKRPSFDSKDSSVHSSGKATLVPNVASNRSLGECKSVSTMEGSPNVENKVVPGKGEKVHQSGGPHTSSRGNVTSNAAPTSSNIPATLSDEELALLLHQELNSSPRVPRVPRMRHAGSLPQATGPSATTLLMKRSSSGGGKDPGVASRRRTKDFSVERSHEVDNDAKKTETKPYSPDNRRQDSGYTVDLLSRKEADGKNVKATKKTNTGSSFSSPSEANGHNVSSSHHPSSRNASDDDPRAVGRQTNRTLPGLIAEIMSEGKRMTYEELCNAVLPHWPHLRKHNGERYAYSSHSQAVLDCLRNRSEWARLVDRGPKTNAGRKRRKLDPDSISIESEDNEDERVKNGKDKSFDSHQEDFPKGKRKARRRRRLALQGRGVVRRRRADVISDDESESFSNSSEDSMSTEEEEEEIQGGGPSLEGSGASSSSDDEVQ